MKYKLMSYAIQEYFIRLEGLHGGYSRRDRFAVAPCECNLFEYVLVLRGTIVLNVSNSMLCASAGRTEHIQVNPFSQSHAYSEKRLSSHCAGTNLYLIKTITNCHVSETSTDNRAFMSSINKHGKKKMFMEVKKNAVFYFFFCRNLFKIELYHWFTG